MICSEARDGIYRFNITSDHSLADSFAADVLRRDCIKSC